VRVVGGWTGAQFAEKRLSTVELSGEADVKGTISIGKYADFAVLSADYFNVDDADISRIESVLTIVGGKIVWSSAEFEGLAAPLPAPAPAWSPVTEFGGFRNRHSAWAEEPPGRQVSGS